MQKRNFWVIEYIYENFLELLECIFARNYLTHWKNFLSIIFKNISWGTFLLKNPIRLWKSLLPTADTWWTWRRWTRTRARTTYTRSFWAAALPAFPPSPTEQQRYFWKSSLYFGISGPRHHWHSRLRQLSSSDIFESRLCISAFFSWTGCRTRGDNLWTKFYLSLIRALL